MVLFFIILFFETVFLGPSPDWVVGVSGLDLCLPNCTWLESKIVDLLPYDAGTDNGITYMVSIPVLAITVNQIKWLNLIVVKN